MRLLRPTYALPFTLIMGLLWWTRAPSHTPLSCSLVHTPGPLGCLRKPNQVLSPCLSTKPEFQHPAAVYSSRCASQAGSAARWRPSALVPLYPAWQPASPCTFLSGKFQAPAAPSRLAKEFPRVRETFLFHSSLPRVQVLSQFPFFPFSPTWLCGDLSCSFGCVRSSASFQLVFCENCCRCSCIFDVFVEGR